MTTSIKRVLLPTLSNDELADYGRALVDELARMRKRTKSTPGTDLVMRLLETQVEDARAEWNRRKAKQQAARQARTQAQVQSLQARARKVALKPAAPATAAAD